MALMLVAQESNPLLGFLPLVWILPVLFIGLKRKNAQRLESGEITIGKKLLNGRSFKFRSSCLSVDNVDQCWNCQLVHLWKANATSWIRYVH